MSVIDDARIAVADNAVASDDVIIRGVAGGRGEDANTRRAIVGREVVNDGVVKDAEGETDVGTAAVSRMRRQRDATIGGVVGYTVEANQVVVISVGLIGIKNTASIVSDRIVGNGRKRDAVEMDALTAVVLFEAGCAGACIVRQRLIVVNDHIVGNGYTRNLGPVRRAGHGRTSNTSCGGAFDQDALKVGLFDRKTLDGYAAGLIVEAIRQSGSINDRVVTLVSHTDERQSTQRRRDDDAFRIGTVEDVDGVIRARSRDRAADL